MAFGATFLVVCGLCSHIITNPPQGYIPKGYVSVQAINIKRQYSPKEIIKTKQFYL